MSSLEELGGSIDAVRSLITLESQYEDPPAVEVRQTAFALRGACVVLTVASFEAFLRSLFEEQLQRIRSQNVPLAHFPEKLRVDAVFASLDLAMKGDHSTRGLDRVVRLGQVSTAARLVAADSFWPRALADTQSNPDAACVKRMFRSVARSAIFTETAGAFQLAWGSPVALSFVETRLDSLIASRNQVAHTADAAHVTRTDLTDNIAFVSVLAQILHHDLQVHVNKLILNARSSFLEQDEVI